MSWSEDAFWGCSWGGFLDAWSGHRRFVCGLDPEETPVGRAEAAALDVQLAQWRVSGLWREDRDG